MAAPARTTKVTRLSECQVQVERAFGAPREMVWRALTEPELIERWQGRGQALHIERNELERGGHWRYVIHTAEGSTGLEGRYREVSCPDTLEKTLEWDGLPGHVSIETTHLDELDGATQMTTTIRYFDKDDRDALMTPATERGMGETFEALDRLLESM